MAGEVDRLHARVQFCSLKANNVVRVGMGLKAAVAARKRNCDEDEDDKVNSSPGESHWEVVERILFIYAKLNPGQGYVQGMNEIIGPIYYTLASDFGGADNEGGFKWRGELRFFDKFLKVFKSFRTFFRARRVGHILRVHESDV
jgi:hypothetical protein